MLVSSYAYLDNAAVFNFDDSTKLFMYPYIDRTCIAGLGSVVLYRNRQLEAVGIDAPYKFMDEEGSGFWTRGSVTQRELSEYMALAISIADDLFDRWLNDEISEQEFMRKWQGIWVTADYSRQFQHRLSNGAERVLTELPIGVKESI
jgi:hypothetical protein